MPKFFTYMPAQFEQYNPEDESFGLNEYDTRDEAGELHSYDDKPSLVYSRDPEEEGGFLNLAWHSHGKLKQRNNKPTSIVYEKNSYSTLGSNMMFNSFDDKPGRITYDSSNNIFFVSYYKNDLLHRENGLPAHLIFDHTGILETKFFEKNRLHRGSGLPARFEDGKQEWFIKGYGHRENGPAIFYDIPSSNMNKWMLFGVGLKERQFNLIKNFQMEKDSPLWLAFLHGLKIISEADADAFLENNFHNELPVDWNLKSLGVTEKVFKEAINNWRKTQGHAEEPMASVKAVLEITEFTTQERRF
jgi:hypothetical protein